MKFGYLNVDRSSAVALVALTALTALCFSLTANAGSSAGNPQSQLGLVVTTSGIVSEIWSAFSRFFEWFWSQSTVDKTKQLSSLIAASSIASNFTALTRAWHAIVAAKPLLNFRGRRIGSSKKYQEPMRALLLSFMFYTAYEFLSQVTDAVSYSTQSRITVLECAIQASLVLLIYWQFSTIKSFATEAFGQDETKQGRFWNLFNEALEEHRVNLKHVFQSAILLPLTFAAPRVAEAIDGGWTNPLVPPSATAISHELLHYFSFSF